MDTNYIQQLQQILQTQFIIPNSELDAIMDNYNVTIQTIIDETGSETAVIEQLGSPHSLAEEIASEFNFIRKTNTDAQSINNIWQKSLTNKNINWPLVIIIGVLFIFIGIPLLTSVFSIFLSAAFIFAGFLISSIILAPHLFTTSPWFILSLFLAGTSTLILIILLAIATMKRVASLVKQFFAIKVKPTPQKRTPLSLLITLTIISIITNTAVFSLPFTDANLRAKIPYNMFRFTTPFNNKVTLTKDIPSQAITQVEIIGKGIQITTSESPDDQYHVRMKTTQDTIDQDIQVENQVLRINKTEVNNCLFCFDFGQKISTIEIAFPRNINLEAFSATISGGSLDLNTINAKNATFQVTGGGISINNLTSNTATFKITGGSIDTHTANIQSTLDMNITGGSSSFKEVSANTANFTIFGGSVDINSNQINQINKDIKGGSLNI